MQCDVPKLSWLVMILSFMVSEPIPTAWHDMGTFPSTELLICSLLIWLSCSCTMARRPICAHLALKSSRAYSHYMLQLRTLAGISFLRTTYYLTKRIPTTSSGSFNCFAYLKWFVSLSCWCIVPLFIQLSLAAPNSAPTHNGLSQIHPNTNYYCNIIKSDIINGSSNMWPLIWYIVSLSYSFV